MAETQHVWQVYKHLFVSAGQKPTVENRPQSTGCGISGFLNWGEEARKFLLITFVELLNLFIWALGKIVQKLKFILISQIPPPTRWIKLNTNRYAFENSGLLGAGALLRNSQGQWIGDFSRKLGITNNMVVEHWAIQDGLSMAHSGTTLYCRNKLYNGD